MALRRLGGEQSIEGGLVISCTYATGTYAAPAVGDLLVQDTAGGNYYVKAITDNAKPLGRVKAVDATNLLLTVEVFRYTQVVKLKYGGTIALGNDILAHGTDHDVDGTGTADSTVVIAKDADTGYVEVLM
jgi:hypothetical protein